MVLWLRHGKCFVIDNYTKKCTTTSALQTKLWAEKAAVDVTLSESMCLSMSHPSHLEEGGYSYKRNSGACVRTLLAIH